MPNANNPAQPLNGLPLLSIVKMLWDRKWTIVSCWLAISSVTVFGAHFLASVYQAEAVVLVDSQKIPENLVSPTVSGDVADRLALISQSIMNSDSLLKIIHEFNLYPKQRTSLTQEELLRRMRDDISMHVEKSWTGGRSQAFRLGFQTSNPILAAEVANRLASLYVAENVHSRENQAEETVRFLRSQLEQAKRSLDEQESKVSEFKLEHNGALPQQENSLLASLSSMRLELQGIQESISRAQLDKNSLEAALSAAESSEDALESALRTGKGGSSLGLAAPPPTRLEQLQAELRSLQLTYTSEYPAVQTVERQIREEKQKEQAAAGERSPKSNGPGGNAPASEASEAVLASPELLRTKERITTLRAQVVSANTQIASLEKERQQLLVEIAGSEGRIGKLPLVEQQMAALKRDYDESASNYNSLLQKELSAGIATDMERSQNSERFTIIDPARVPEKPFKPKQGKVIAAGCVAGLLFGVLLGFGLEYRQEKFLGEWELPSHVPILGRVPMINPV